MKNHGRTTLPILRSAIKTTPAKISSILGIFLGIRIVQMRNRHSSGGKLRSLQLILKK